MKKFTRTRGECGASGFTLVELMVTVAVLAIVVGIGAPDLMQMIQRQAVASAMQTLTADLRFTRSEALKRGVIVELCGASLTTNNSTTTYSCVSTPSSGSRSNWLANGWIVRDTQTGDVLRVSQHPLGVGGLDSSRASLPFLPTGLLQGVAANVLATPLSASNTSALQLACINSTGRKIGRAHV